MLGSPLLGTAVGLVLLFATTALLCSGVTETLSSLLELRAKYLLTGMRTLLDAPERAIEKGDRKDGNVLTAARAAMRAARVVRDSAAAAERAAQVAGADREPPAATEPDRLPEVAGTSRASDAASRASRAAAFDAAKEAFRRELGNSLHERVKRPWVTQDAANELRARLAGRVPGSGTSAEPIETTSPTGAADPHRVPRREEVTTALWSSPLLRTLQSRRVGFFSKGTLRNPQYVSGRTFARALVDLLVPAEPGGPVPAEVTVTRISAAVEGLPDPLRQQLRAFLACGITQVEDFEKAVEQWYDEQMDKIGGWYKRWSRVVLGIVGFIVAVMVNIDTVQVAHSLYVDAPVQQAVAATANAGTLCQGETDPELRRVCADNELQSLSASGLPFGYPGACSVWSVHQAACWAWAEGVPRHWWDFPFKLLGWVITAFAVSFGAPFWFEALSRLGSLRSSGAKPAPST